MQNSIAIVILNYKNYKDTINCIDSIYNNVPANEVCLIIVDNASNNDSLNIINSNFSDRRNIVKCSANAVYENAEIILLQNETNKGYAAGNNLGLKLAYKLGFDYSMILNNDTLFINHPLNQLLAALKNNKDVLCVGPLLLLKNQIDVDYNCAKKSPTAVDLFILSYWGKSLRSERWKKNFYYLKGTSNRAESVYVDIISGSCMLFDSHKLHKVDYLDEATFLYYEEAILSAKAKKYGYKMMIDTTAKVIHLGGQTTKSQTSNSFTLKCEHESLKHYVNNYSDFNFFEKLFVIATNKLFLNLYKAVKG